ncbi:MAG: hypothetical protein WEB58_21720 [Planctomycetaceae bacterium]
MPLPGRKNWIDIIDNATSKNASPWSRLALLDRDSFATIGQHDDESLKIVGDTHFVFTLAPIPFLNTDPTKHETSIPRYGAWLRGSLSKKAGFADTGVCKCANRAQTGDFVLRSQRKERARRRKCSYLARIS